MKNHRKITTGPTVRVEPMPRPEVLEQASQEVRDAIAALEQANEASREAARAEAVARKARRLEEVPSKISAKDDALHEAEQEARDRLRDAQRAAGNVVRLLDEEAEDLARKAARKQVEDHVRAANAYADLVDVVGTRDGGRTLDRPPHRLAPWASIRTQAKPDTASFGRYLDETDIDGLLERAGMTGEEAGLVRVFRKSKPAVRFWTTPARAAVLSSDYEEVQR